MEAPARERAPRALEPRALEPRALLAAVDLPASLARAVLARRAGRFLAVPARLVPVFRAAFLAYFVARVPR